MSRAGTIFGIAIIALVLVVRPSAAGAWGNKEHIQFTRLAAERLIAAPDTPPGMKAWLREGIGEPLTMEQEKGYFLHKRIGIFPRGVDGLTFWATVPDLNALADRPDQKVEPYGVAERLLHYIDVEYFSPDESKRTYAHDLSHKPTPADFPDDMADVRYQRAGMLPFAVRGTYQRLVEALKARRMKDAPGQFPRDDHAMKWAGILAHYAADNTQPQHATLDYKSASYFADKRKAPNVHAEVEYRMADDEHNDYMALREEFWPLFVVALDEAHDPATTDDPWKSTIEVSLHSYDALPLIGAAAMAAARQGGTPDAPRGPAGRFDTAAFFHHKGAYAGQDMTVMRMKAIQTALAVHRIERLWRQAWEEAHPGAPSTRSNTQPAAAAANDQPAIAK